MLKKTILVILLLSVYLFPQTGSVKLTNEINKIINDDFFTDTQIAIDIYDLTSGKTLFKHNEKLLLHPASNMKLLTSAAGLIFLGPGYTFKTSLHHSGIISGDTLYGSIYVKGGLDPDFTTTDLDSMLQFIKLLGINVITGNLCADISVKDSLYWGKGWMWDDDPDPSAPYLSALNINKNSIEVLVQGDKVGSPPMVTLMPHTNYVNVINNAVTVSSNNENDFDVTRDWVNRTNDIIISGEVKAGAITDTSDNLEQVNLLYPEKYFLTLMKEHLDSIGIKVNGDIKVKTLPGNTAFISSYERPLDSVIVNMNKESDNLSAEMLLYALALNDSGAPATAENGIASLKRMIDSLGLNPDDYSLADGSGVSRYNLLSAELLTGLLKFMFYKKDLFELYYNSLPVAGVDGTLEKRMIGTNAETNVHAKTGTIAGVSSLSGYVTAKNNHTIAFSILIQNFLDDETKVARKFQDKICNLLTDYK